MYAVASAGSGGTVAHSLRTGEAGNTSRSVAVAEGNRMNGESMPR